MRKGIRYYIFFLILLVGFTFLYIKQESLQPFLNLKVLELLALLSLTYLAFVMMGLAFKYLLKIFDLNLNYREWFGLTVCNTMFNYYLPAKGGTVAKALYLKKKHGFGYSYYLSLVAGATVLGFFLTAVLGLISVVLVYILTNRFLYYLGGFFLVCMAGALFSVVLTHFMKRLKLKVGQKKIHILIANLKEGFSYFSSHRKFALGFCLFSFLFIMLMAVRLYLCFRVLGYDADFLPVVIIRSIAEFSFLISLVPGNLGIKEGIIIFAARIFNIPGDYAIAAAILDRAVSMALIFGLGFMYSKSLLGSFDTVKAGKNLIEGEPG